MKIATWNVNSLGVRLPQVSAWLAEQQPDVLCLQETKTIDARFPAAELAALGYHSVFHGQPTYNGVAILSRETPDASQVDWPDGGDGQARVVAVTLGDLRIWDVYVPNGQALDSDKYAYKLAWLERLRDLLRAELQRWPRLLLLGDFNIAPADRDVYDPEAWGADILCSPPERDALRALLALGLHDSQRVLDSESPAWTWWDYRAAGFRRDRGLRIDLILASSALLPQLRSVVVDRDARGAERPSDHAPVTLTLETPL